MNRILFSSLRTDWKTPQQLFDKLDTEFSFDYDPCPSTPQFNGLTEPWGSTSFVNPPYNRAIANWLKKALAEHRQGKTVVFLLPARTDTEWFHEIILPNATELRFLKGRLKFSGHKNSAPFPSMIVIFRAQ